MWSGVTGLYLAYLFQQPPTNFGGVLQTLSHNANHIDAAFLLWARLPIVILAAGCVVLLYRLGAQLLNYPIAIIAALMLAFDPLFLAHSRTLHHDALATIFMSLGVLALLNFSASWKFGYLIYQPSCPGLPC
jgi:4-amino-4-deoxy-L-arabinose transferase-like glycosyltransferase